MQTTEIIGLIAACLTTTAFFPQVIKTVKSKSTKDISLPMYSLMFAGTISWLIYGLLKNDLPIILANGVSSVAAFVIFYFKIKEVMHIKKSKK
jgi:MtN3 and saliva related transmembrane protein